MAVEAGQRASDEQGEVWNRGLFPLILDVRAVLRAHPPRFALCGAAAICGTGTRSSLSG
jgi:renierapurpurin 18,18'-hydroxylase